MKVRKSILKKVKLAASGKLLRRHQLGAGHLKRNKTKGALERAKKPATIAKAFARTYKKVLGL